MRKRFKTLELVQVHIYFYMKGKGSQKPIWCVGSVSESNPGQIHDGALPHTLGHLGISRICLNHDLFLFQSVNSCKKSANDFPKLPRISRNGGALWLIQFFGCLHCMITWSWEFSPVPFCKGTMPFCSCLAI